MDEIPQILVSTYSHKYIPKKTFNCSNFRDILANEVIPIACDITIKYTPSATL